jgi:hypothetical protein
MIRPLARVQPAPAETDPGYEALVELEREEVEEIRAEMERAVAEVKRVSADPDADRRSVEIARLLNGSGP